ncbi:MAG: ribonuclease III [Halioglobus sp.]|nr:ribonuclease III [Halioglobus sp.]
MTNLVRLQQALGHEFSDPQLLVLALTHRSAGRSNNERLEFLGDSIVNHIIAEALFEQFPASREGDMSRMRSALVRGATLAEIARELQLGDYLLLGPGERRSGGHRRASILADALEAVAGAILLDNGFERCRSCVRRWFGPRLEQLTTRAAAKDAKTQLQEHQQGRGNPLPDYELVSVQGEDHNQQFRVLCRITRPALVAEGAGSSRRKAEQAAARTALQRLADHGG